MKPRILIATSALCVSVVLAFPTAAFAYPTSSSGTVSTSVFSAIVDPCHSDTVSGSGYQANELVTVTLGGPNLVLTTATTDGTGSFSKTFELPSSVRPGSYSIASSGTSGDTSTTGLTVGTGGCAVTSAAVSGSGLAFTGADIAAVSGAGAVALALGGTLVLVARRRRRSTT